MLILIVSLMGLGWVYRHTVTGKVVALIVGSNFLYLATATGSAVSSLWVLSLVMTLVSARGLYQDARRYF